MYYVYTDGITDFEIDFSKLGLTFRKLNVEEEKNFLSRYQKVYRLKKEFNNCIRVYDNDRLRFRKIKTELESKDNIIEFLLSEWRFHEKKPVFHKSVDALLDKIMVIDINEEKLKKYIEPEDFNIFLKQFIGLSFIYDKKTIDLKNDKPLFLSKRFNFTAEEEIIAKYLFNDCSNPSSHLLVSSKSLKMYCDIMYEFFSKLDADEIFRFIEIIEMYNIVNGFKPNLLINNILIIESLIINGDKDKNIAKEFVRKTALFLINGNENYKLKNCITELDYLYNIRSDIVHGNTKKLFSDFGNLKNTLPDLNYPSIDRESKMHKKIIIVKFSYALSERILNDILKLWLSKPDELKFIKNM